MGPCCQATTATTAPTDQACTWDSTFSQNHFAGHHHGLPFTFTISDFPSWGGVCGDVIRGVMAPSVSLTADHHGCFKVHSHSFALVSDSAPWRAGST